MLPVCAEKLKEQKKILSDCKKEMVDFYTDRDIPVCAKIILTPFVLLLFAVILLIYLFAYGYALFLSEKYKDQEENLKNIYTPETVAGILYRIINDNQQIFETSRMSNIEEILPTRQNVVQMDNSFAVYYFVASHKRMDEDDTDTKLDFLNVKLEQQLQASYYNYPILYQGVPVLRAIRFAEDIYHTGCYGIEIMLIDSDEKIDYLRKKADSKPKVIGNLPDEDF